MFVCHAGGSSGHGVRPSKRFVEWKEIVGRHGLRLSLEKTEMLWVGQQNKDVRLERKQLKQRDSFAYLGGAVCGASGSGDGRRIQAEANIRMEDSGRVMGDYIIYQKPKRKVLSLCIKPAYLCGLEIIAITSKITRESPSL